MEAIEMKQLMCVVAAVMSYAAWTADLVTNVTIRQVRLACVVESSKQDVVPYPEGGPYESEVDGILWKFMIDAELNAVVGTQLGGEESGSWGGGDFDDRSVSSTTTGMITVPSILGGRVVTAIGNRAFCYCQGLTNVVLPEGVKSIRNAAFMGCSNLKDVVIPEGVLRIGAGAFECCGLESVNIPSSVTNIGHCAFGGCSYLTNAIIPEGINCLSERMFKDCISLTKLRIPSSVADIEYGVFENCTNIVELSVSENNNFFRSQNGMVFTKDGATVVCGVNGNVVLPEGVTTIGKSAFRGYKLNSVIIPQGVTNICTGAFACCPMPFKIVFRGDAPILETKTVFGAVSSESCAFVSRNSKGWGVEIPGMWNGIQIKWLEDDLIPDLGAEPTAESIGDALSVFLDEKVLLYITNAHSYVAFREWSGKVQPQGGGDAVGAAGVMAAPNAWVSYALGSETLLEAAPTDADLTVEAFEPKSGEDGKFDFTVSVEGVEVGGAATTEAQKEQVKENLKQVFGLEGGTALKEGEMSSANVDIEFGTPQDGKVKFTAGPKDTDAKTFFMKVKVMP